MSTEAITTIPTLEQFQDYDKVVIGLFSVVLTYMIIVLGIVVPVR